MQIQAIRAYAASYLNRTTRPAPASAPLSTGGDDRSTISQEARDRLAAESTTGASALYGTSKGTQALDIDAYFATGTGTSPVLLGDSLPPLLVPNQQNIDALTQHISDKMPQFLTRNGIPSAPEKITYDNAGRMQLPDDYPYADEFRQALENDPVLDRQLHTVNALASHFRGLQRSLAFQKDYAAADNQAEIDAVIAAYQDLFSGNKTESHVSLNFTPSGALSVDMNA